MAALEDRYKWVDWNAMAHHLHMGDVHFFDQEVPYVDQDFTIRPDFRLLHRLEGANRLKTLQEHEDKKIMRLLDFGYWITSGATTRVATEGKIRSVWTMLVAGDQNGTASFGFGKAADMALAEKRALADLRRNMLFVPLFESRTLSHEIRGRHGVCQVRMWPRPRSHGMTAGMIPRMLFECFGIQDITAKVDGRALPHHQALAIFNGLREVKVLREEAARRGVTAHKMFERGLHTPRHPGREEMIARGNEVTSILRHIRATQVDEEMSGVPPEDRTYREPNKFASPIDNPNPDKVYVSGYIEERPLPEQGEMHRPGPLFPNSKRAAVKETLFRRRGLPQPTTRRQLEHTRLAGRH
jgi:small subunit ribosomal protein S5